MIWLFGTFSVFLSHLSQDKPKCCRAVTFLVNGGQFHDSKVSCRELQMPVTECVSADQLKAYALGRLDDELADQVSGHLKDCSACEETLSSFDDTNDSLLLHIRTAEPAVDESPASLQTALKGITALRSAATASDCQQLFSDDWIRDYRLIGQLGQGGMGTVYKAVHEKLQRTVAIKLLPARRLRNREAVGRFEREMRAIGRLDHPAIVRATDAGEFEGTHFLAMDFVHGIDLGKVMRLTGPLSIPDACEVIRVTATGLSYAHDQGLIHRDVKPSNVMLALSENGDVVSVKLLDLGLALFGAASEAVDDFTTVGQLMGTLDYMAPEQADHSKVNVTADVYSLGATLFKLLTGKAPFETEQFQNPLQKMKCLATMTASSLADRLPDADPKLVAVADQLLQRNPEDRIASAAEVATAIAPFCDGHQLRDVAETAIVAQSVERAELESRLPQHVCPPVPAAMLAGRSKPKATVQPAVASGSNGTGVRWKRWIAGLAGAPLMAFLGVIIWIQTDRGTLKIESVADDVPIEIRQGKDLVESFTLKSGPNEITLRSGRHEVLIAAKFDQLQMSNNTVEIQRGGQAVVRIEYAKTVPDPLGPSTPDSLVFEGRTYAEWKSILDRERSPAELTKAIDALASLTDDSNTAITCETILKIMDRYSCSLNDESVESLLLTTGLRRIRELNPGKTIPVLCQALHTRKRHTWALLIHVLAWGNTGGGNYSLLGPVDPLKLRLLQSGEFFEAAYISYRRFDQPEQGSLNFSASTALLLRRIVERMHSGELPSSAMLNLCQHIVDGGTDHQGWSEPFTFLWDQAALILLEVTDQTDLVDVVLKHMTHAPFDFEAWKQISQSPTLVRKMLPRNQARLNITEPVMLEEFRGSNLDMTGRKAKPNGPYFFSSTLMVELIGLAGTDAASSIDDLNQQFMKFTGTVPVPSGDYGFRPINELICSDLESLEKVKQEEHMKPHKANLRHVQALLWAYEQVTGTPPKFSEPMLPKFRDLPSEWQPVAVR